MAAETSTISWGTSVAGELGYGDEEGTPRTSTKPKLVDPLEGLTVMQVAMGYGHSLLLARYIPVLFLSDWLHSRFMIFCSRARNAKS